MAGAVERRLALSKRTTGPRERAGRRPRTDEKPSDGPSDGGGRAPRSPHLCGGGVAEAEVSRELRLGWLKSGREGAPGTEGRRSTRPESASRSVWVIQ